MAPPNEHICCSLTETAAFYGMISVCKSRHRPSEKSSSAAQLNCFDFVLNSIFIFTTISKHCQNVVFKNAKFDLKIQNLDLNIQNLGPIKKFKF